MTSICTALLLLRGDIICLTSFPQDTAIVMNNASAGETGRKCPRRRGNK